MKSINEATLRAACDVQGWACTGSTSGGFTVMAPGAVVICAIHDGQRKLYATGSFDDVLDVMASICAAAVED